MTGVEVAEGSGQARAWPPRVFCDWQIYSERHTGPNGAAPPDPARGQACCQDRALTSIVGNAGVYAGEPGDSRLCRKES